MQKVLRQDQAQWIPMQSSVTGHSEQGLGVEGGRGNWAQIGWEAPEGRVLLARVETLDFMLALFLFWRSLHTVFHNGGTNLYSHQQCARVSFSPRPHQHLLSFFLLKWGAIAFWFWFALLWWLAMLNIFSYLIIIIIIILLLRFAIESLYILYISP
jgi:hypothetical protein